MKKRWTFVFLLPLSSGWCQEPGLAQFWNSYGFINPAADGTSYRHQAAISGLSDLDRQHGSTDYQTAAVYGIRLEKLSSGLGVHFRYTDGYADYNRAGFNYNYQFRLNAITRVSVGAGLDYENTWQRAYYMEHPSAPPTIAIFTSWMLNTGFLLRHGPAQLGGGITALNQPKRTYPWDKPGFPPRRAFLHLEYVLKIGENVQLTPRILGEVVGAFNKDPQFGELTVVAEGCYNERLRAGLGYRVRQEQAIVTAGWDIKTRYRVGYALQIDVSGPSYNLPVHELVLGILLGKVE